MMKYALVNNNTKKVENIIIASDDFTMPGFELVKLQEGQKVNIGDIWNGINFIPSEPQIPTIEERLEALEVAMLEMVLGGAD